jgi:hypothetical protein
LTEEEHQECQAFLTSVIPQRKEGSWYMPEELIEPFKRSMVAFCMIQRANRFAIVKQAREACQAASKACVIYPLSVYFYDFACVLETLGQDSDSRTLFGEFIRRHECEPQNKVDEIVLGQRDLSSMVDYARSKTGG